MDHVHPLMAQIVGEDVTSNPRGGLADLQNPRCKDGRSLYNGYLDRESPFDDVPILQTYVRAVQAPL